MSDMYGIRVATSDPCEFHRDYLTGLLTRGELLMALSECGADDETVRMEVPDSALLEDYFEHMRRKRAGEPSGFILSEGGEIGVHK